MEVLLVLFEAGTPFPTLALALNARVVLDCSVHVIPPITCPRNRVS